jgi:hypothetical protein
VRTSEFGDVEAAGTAETPEPLRVEAEPWPEDQRNRKLSSSPRPPPFPIVLDCSIQISPLQTLDAAGARGQVPTSIRDHRRLPALPGSNRLETQVGNSHPSSVV